VPSGSIV
jgi:hypothetical protein